MRLNNVGHCLSLHQIKPLIEKGPLCELTRLGKWHEFHLYKDTDHAFCNFSGERFRPRASRAAWNETLAFFEETLKA